MDNTQLIELLSNDIARSITRPQKYRKAHNDNQKYCRDTPK